MKYIYLLLTFLLLLGCSLDSNNQESNKEPFTITFSHKGALYGNTTASGGVLYRAMPATARLIILSDVALDPNSLSPNTVYIQAAAGRPAASVDLYDIEGTQYIVVTPDAELEPFSTFNLVMTTDVSTTSGAHRSTNAVISFTTDKGDITPPRIIGSLPQRDAQDVEPYTTIYFQFSESLSPLSLSGLDFNVTGSNDELISGTISLSGALLSFVPDNTIAYDSDGYTVTLSTATLQDYSGNIYKFTNSPYEQEDGTLQFNFLPVTPEYETPYNTFSPSKADMTLSAQPNCMKSVGYEVFIGTDNGLDILLYNPESSSTPLALRSHLEDSQLGSVYSLDINLTTNRAYIGSSTGFSIVDISDLNNTSIISHWTNYGFPIYGLDILDGHAYLAGSSTGFVDLDISNENNPTQLNIEKPYENNGDSNPFAFDIMVYDSETILAIDYSNGLYLTDMGFSVFQLWTNTLQGQVHNIVPSSYNISAGIAGIGLTDNNNYLPTASYITRIVEGGSYSVGIVKDIGFLFFDSDEGGIYEYIKTPFEVSMVGYIDTFDNGSLHLIVADDQGNLYIKRIGLE